MAQGPDDRLNWDAWAHAVRKLGYAVTEENAGSFTDDELAAWNAAVEEYVAEHGRGNGTED